ncbi:hypothetical protein [uncultured Dokdonia sp.]|uniref:hypothetical protein n=1 Tax=uncultured Dokdonia sp. TaxID=575653 RepID=UPI002626C50B|nr:hypothetical protein [uncultured Dokdonia sp.]
MTTFLLVVGYTSIAQEVVTGGPNPPPPPPTPGSIPGLPGLVVPIDENLIILLILGVITGIVYLLRNRYRLSKS